MMIWSKSLFVLISSLLLGVLIAPVMVYGKTIVALKILPENVGVFYQNKSQQFQAIAVFDDNSEEDYSNEVGWSLEANPLPVQDLSPEQVASINENGLVTVNNTYGRIHVVATYPKPKPPIAELTGVFNLLLGATCDQIHLNLCVEKSTCENAGGFWWISDECHSTEDPTVRYMPAINFLLLK